METEKREEIHIDEEANLKGEVCPYTFVMSKLALEELELGEVLRVIVDHEPAVTNVPRSMANEGQKVLRVAKISETDWEIVIRKEREY